MNNRCSLVGALKVINLPFVHRQKKLRVTLSETCSIKVHNAAPLQEGAAATVVRTAQRAITQRECLQQKFQACRPRNRSGKQFTDGAVRGCCPRIAVSI